MKQLNSFICAACVVSALAVAGPSRAAESGPESQALPELSSAKAAELPSKAAELIAKADAAKQADVTKEVVKAAVGLNPAAAPAIVGGIAQAVPDMAALAAGTATKLVPNQAAAIARAAVAAAPKQVAKIVAAVCAASPASYREIGVAVAEVAPDATQQILAGIATGVPALKDAINQVLPGYKGALPSVSTVLADVASVSQSGKLLAGGSAPSLGAQTFVTVGAPVSLPTTPSSINPGTGGQTPTGGRGYAAP